VFGVRDRRVVSNVLRHALRTAADEAAWTSVALVGCAAGTGSRRDLQRQQQLEEKHAANATGGNEGEVKGTGGGEPKNLALAKSVSAAQKSAAQKSSVLVAGAVTAGGALSDDLCASIGRRLRLRTLVLDRACGANVTDAGLGRMLAALSGTHTHLPITRMKFPIFFTCVLKNINTVTCHSYT
jgi:hypothetical protein